MKRKLYFNLCGVILNLFISVYYAEAASSVENVIIRTYLFKGKADSIRDSQAQAKAFYFGSPILPIRLKASLFFEKEIDYLRNIIACVYRFPGVDYLTSADMRWEGKRGVISEIVLDDIDSYNITIYPQSISDNDFQLKIEGSKSEFEKVSYFEEKAHFERLQKLRVYCNLFIDAKNIQKSVGSERWLDKELNLKLNNPVFIALPNDDRSLFLAMQVLRIDEKRMDIGLIGNRLLSYNIGGTDPVCGKKVGIGDGYNEDNVPNASIKYKGETYLFCSNLCSNEFESNPDKYLKKVKNRRPIIPESMLTTAPRPKIFTVPELPELELENSFNMSAKLNIDIDKAGNILNIRSNNSIAGFMEDIVQELYHQWVFEPRILAGNPVSSEYSMQTEIASNKNEQIDDQINVVTHVPEGPDILPRVADYCNKLENAALFYVCREMINEKIYSNSGLKHISIVVHDRLKNRGTTWSTANSMYGEDARGEENSFIYDLQLIRQGSRIKEKRALIAENGNNMNDDHVYPRTKRFYIDKTIFGPIGFFGKEVHSVYRYRLLREGKYEGKPIDIIEIVPNIMGKGTIYGKAWVERMSGAIYKMEINAESIIGYDRITADYESEGLRPSIYIEIVYGIEHNGLRYPSHATLKESYYGIKMSELTIDYDRYKYFTVGTEVKY